jgi:hypothetical protein
MGDGENKDKQVKDKQVPTWITIATAFFSFISTVLVAFIGVTANIRIEEIRSQTASAQNEIAKLNASIKESEVALEQRRFDAEQRARHDQTIIDYVPKLLSSNDPEKQAAIAVLFVLYPNEAKDILSRVAESLGEDSAAELEQSIEQRNVSSIVRQLKLEFSV